MLSSSLRPDALHAYRLFESDDVEETRELISRVMQPHTLSPSGNPRARSFMDFVRLGGSGLGVIAFGDAMRVEVESVEGYYLLMFCLAGRAEVRLQGRTMQVDRDRGVLCAPGQPFEAKLSPDCQQFVLRIDPAALATQTGTSSPKLRTEVSVGGGRLRGWLQQLQLLTSAPELLACASENPRVGVHLERLLLDLLVVGHTNASTMTGRPALAPGFVKRAEDFMTGNCAEALQLSDISAAVGVPARTLRDGFQRFRGVSPMQHLRRVRLARARDALLAAPGEVRVADIALDCGFTHLGRFAIAYKKIFGESPSDTLKHR
ncbi:anthranilate 1,2-dioxygenase regulatory protein AndR [Paraburkholderia gardini]|nr:anthranilate 1,2-dioxygenase regulatory protein AndR [Paraburkholderia gardini]